MPIQREPMEIVNVIDKSYLTKKEGRNVTISKEIHHENPRVNIEA